MKETLSHSQIIPLPDRPSFPEREDTPGLAASSPDSMQVLQSLVEIASDNGIWAIDENAVTTFVNEKMARMLGYSPHEMVGQLAHRFGAKDEADKARAQMELRRKGLKGQIEFRMRRKDGEFITGLFNASPLFSETGKYKGTLAMVIDLSDHLGSHAPEHHRLARLASEQAVQFQAAREEIRARDEFFSIASHELKTPITSLRLQLELARRTVTTLGGSTPHPANESLKKMLEIAHRQTDRLVHLVESLLDFTRAQAGKFTLYPEKVALHELVCETTRLFLEDLRQARCPIELECGTEVYGYWDRSRIEQIVVNLVSNAIKYAPGSPIQIAVTQEIGRARLSVRDTGPGIAPERQAALFQPYKRASHQKGVPGLGLGLYIVKQIVEAHEGSITLDSTPGHGTEFIVTLPLIPSRTVL